VRRAAASLAAALMLLAPPARAQNQVAPDDPALLQAISKLCLRAALSSGGIDKTTGPYCTCVAPVFARHMTPDSRYRLTTDKRFTGRPSYDDDKATFDDVMKACPLKK